MHWKRLKENENLKGSHAVILSACFVAVLRIDLQSVMVEQWKKKMYSYWQ